jgi:hypothetical protein
MADAHTAPAAHRHPSQRPAPTHSRTRQRPRGYSGGRTKPEEIRKLADWLDALIDADETR